ncbi:MAG: DUF4381 family protein, partial [Planctomycetota bacterium]
ALSGPAWARFLDRTGGGGRFEAGLGASLERLAFAGVEPEDPDALLAVAERWIRAQGGAR